MARRSPEMCLSFYGLGADEGNHPAWLPRFVDPPLEPVKVSNYKERKG